MEVKGKEIHKGFMESLYRLIDNPQKELDRSRSAAREAFEKERKSTYNWDLPKSMFHIDRVAFNKCKTSRKRKGLDCMLATYQSSYNRNQGEIKTINKKHHGFVIGHTLDRGLAVICDDAKLRYVKESDVVYL